MLSQQEGTVTWRELAKQPAEVAEVLRLAELVPGGVQALVSTRSRRYKELGLAGKAFSDAELAALLAAEPGIWRRPITVRDGRVVIGYDAAAMLELLA